MIKFIILLFYCTKLAYFIHKSAAQQYVDWYTETDFVWDRKLKGKDFSFS